MRELIARAALRLHNIEKREEGVTVMEYGITVALVSLVIAGLLAGTAGVVMNAIQAAILAEL